MPKKTGLQDAHHNAPQFAHNRSDAAAQQPDKLSALLSRLASMQGHAVPWHRFAMMSVSVDGAPMEDLHWSTRVIELWRARFPSGDARQANLPLSPGELPAFWIGPAVADAPEPEMLIVRGGLAGGALSCVDVEGAPVELGTSRVRQGLVLVLLADEPLDERATRLQLDRDGETRARSAGQWFRFAIAKRKRVFFDGAVASLTVNAIGLATAFFTMQVYDRVLPTQGYATLWVLTSGVAIAILLEFVMRQVRARMVERACKAIDEELSSVFFGHALAIRMDQRPRTVGTFAAQIRHFEMVRNFMTSSTLFVFADLPFALLFIGVIALIAGPVAIVPAMFIPLAIIAGLAFRKRLARITEAHMEEGNRKNGLLIEAIDGIETIKASGAEWKVLERWRELTQVLSRDEVQMKDITSLSQGLTQSLQQSCYIALVAVGAYAIGTGSLTMGGLIACTIISGRALQPVAQISGLIVQWQHARFALKGLDGIMALEGDTSPGERRVVPDHCRGMLRIESVRFTYGGEAVALDIEQFKVGPGERVAVLGAVGSGKSTLVKALSGLYRPADGRVFLDDVDIAHLAPEFVREHIGYLAQDVRLFQGTLRDNLALGLHSPTDGQILEAARQTGLDRLLTTHPQGLGLEISEGGRGLSGGQRQLVGLTRLLIQRPRIMLLDEPTASMDAQLEEYIAANVFARRPDDTTLVVVTHKPSMLRHFTRIVVTDRGRIVADGPREEILVRFRQGGAQPATPVPTVGGLSTGAASQAGAA